MYQEVQLTKVYKLQVLYQLQIVRFSYRFGTLFNTELKIGDEITLYRRSNLVTRIVESIISNTSLHLSSVVSSQMYQLKPLQLETE